MPLNLYDAEGHRKHLTAGKREAFFRGAEDAPREVRTFCPTLAHAGCRISEKWLGHADLKTTAIYADAAGAEEDRIAERMWGAL